jgi:hypothetical protein
MNDIELLQELQSGIYDADLHLEPSLTLKGYWETSVSYLGESRSGIHANLRDAINAIFDNYIDCIVSSYCKEQGIQRENKQLIIIP